MPKARPCRTIRSSSSDAVCDMRSSSTKNSWNSSMISNDRGIGSVPPARFVDIQTETAVRHVASTHPYDAHEDGQLSLRQNAEEITSQLTGEIAARVGSAGVRIIESRLTRLSFAPEIDQAMLRRQQASAVVAARKTIVEGAVGMVEMALARIKERGIVDLDAERKAAMVSNLLVVLCSEQNTQPIVNAGTLYN